MAFQSKDCYRLQALTDGNGQPTRYFYNPAGSLAGVLHPGGDTIQFPAYDLEGNVLKRLDGREMETDFDAFVPATGEAFTHPCGGRTIANWVDFLCHVEGWLPAEAGTVYAVLDNLSTHRAADVLLFSLAHPRWQFVFQPVYAAYLNLIEPWWKVLRSLALKGRRFETWGEIAQAVEQATAYWNAHRHPFVWGRRRRHRPKRKAGLALVPAPA